jgi:hypothetical protein
MYEYNFKRRKYSSRKKTTEIFGGKRLAEKRLIIFLNWGVKSCY